MNRVSAALILLLALPLMGQDIQFLTDQVIDKGTVAQGDVLEGTIEFVNQSNREITLAEVKASCGCTAVKPDKKVFAPGEKGAIPFSVHTDNFSGVIRKSIRVSFEGVEPASNVFVVSADVKSPGQLTPRYISLQNISVNPDTVVTEFFEIENNSAVDVTVQSITTTLPALRVSPEAVTIPPGKSHLIRVDFTPAEAGRVNSEIQINTDNVRMPALSLRVFIYVSGNQAAVSKSGS